MGSLRSRQKLSALCVDSDRRTSSFAPTAGSSKTRGKKVTTRVSDQRMIDHEPRRETDREGQSRQVTESAYQSVRSRLVKVRETELLAAKRARKRAGITEPACLYDKQPGEIDLVFETAMQRLWDLGSIDDVGRTDPDARRLYYLIAKGLAPLAQADVVKLGAMPEAALRLLVPWLAQQVGLIEAQDHVDLGETAPPLTNTY
jgi:hypothetical protein